nr:MAG TPA: hypothetical protein [Caudoviricetes sp.]
MFIHCLFKTNCLQRLSAVQNSKEGGRLANWYTKIGSKSDL